MRFVARMWETTSRSERIVGMALVAGSTIAITNSTVWAIAVSYMTHQKTRVQLAQLEVERRRTATPGTEAPDTPDTLPSAFSVAAPPPR